MQLLPHLEEVGYYGTEGTIFTVTNTAVFVFNPKRKKHLPGNWGKYSSVKLSGRQDVSHTRAMRAGLRSTAFLNFRCIRSKGRDFLLWLQYLTDHRSPSAQ